MALNDYRIKDTLYENEKTLVYSATSLIDNAPVIIKTSPVERGDQARLCHDYEIGVAARASGVIAYHALEYWQERVALIMEDSGGLPLHQLIESKALSMGDKLWIAVCVSETLNHLHQLRIIHKDIKPHNIIVNLATRQVKLIDFCIATRLPRECQSISSPTTLEGSLPYMSPEQTGRMNRSLDYRTDFYSLGVTLYELFAGTLPYHAQDAMEWVHCHLARQPRLPHAVNREVPPMISAIIMRLMEKSAETRYQSAYGVLSDLENCRQQWMADHRIVEFDLARKDISERFEISQKLYGRDDQIALLLQTFNRMCSGNKEMMLVAGPSGIGKSSLISEIHKPIVGLRGYFIGGKFDQFHKNIPYSALIDAFTNLVRQILTESPQQIESWKANLLSAVGENGQVIIDVIPELALIIGPQPALTQLLPAETQNRFLYVIINFVKVFAIRAHPLVLFLDDMQWADSGTLKMLESLLGEEDVRYLFLIAAYRNNEVGPSHPFAQTLEKITKCGMQLNEIALPPLTPNDLNLWLADTLRCSKEDCFQLGALLIQKTQGNPFFFSQLLQSLHEKQLIWFEAEKRCWAWNLDAIKELEIPEDMARWMVEKLQTLPPIQLSILKHAACIGNKFSLSTLCMVMESEPAMLLRWLRDALDVGLIVPLGEAYTVMRQLSDHASSVNAADKGPAASLLEHDIAFQFLHDRVELAAYSLIPAEEKLPLHRNIGALLVLQLNAEEREERIFEIVSHLNQAAALITVSNDRLQLARLNFDAAVKARASAAFDTSLDYLKSGMAQLPDDAWKSEYELTLKMHLMRADNAIITSDFAQMQEMVDRVKRCAANLLDRISAYEIEIRAYSAQSKLHEGLHLTREALRLLGEDFPEKVHKGHILVELAKAMVLLRGKNFESLAKQPLTDDTNHLARLRIRISSAGGAYLADPNMYTCLILSGLRQILTHGNSPWSPIHYATFGSILSSGLGLLEKGASYVRFGLELADRLKTGNGRKEIAVVFNCWIGHWRTSLRDTLPRFLEGYNDALSVGSLEFAGYQSSGYCWTLFYAGENLEIVLERIRHHNILLRKNGMERQYQVNKTQEQVVLNLMGESNDPTMLIGEAFDEAAALPRLYVQDDVNQICTISHFKTMLFYFFGDYEKAYDSARMMLKYKDAVVGLSLLPVFYQFYALTLVALIPKAGLLQRPIYIAKAKLALRQIKVWAGHAPMNNLHRQYLIEAEFARINGRRIRAMTLYNQAIMHAEKNAFFQDLALANELACRFYLNLGLKEVAAIHFAKAHSSYGAWGSKGKVAALENEFPQWLKELTPAAAPATQKLDSGLPGLSFLASLTSTLSPALSGTAVTHVGDRLDTLTALKAAQAISGEMHLATLLERIMQIVMENAGAQRGLLLLQKEDQLLVQFEVGSDESPAGMLTGKPVDEYAELPQSLINYALRQKKSVVLDNAVDDQLFGRDPYVAARRCKSLLCIPIQHYTKLIGILYLENNLSAGTFTADRLQMLQILSSQAAISIENAKLYGDLQAASDSLKEQNVQLEQKVEERTKDLKQLYDEIKESEAKLRLAKGEADELAKQLYQLAQRDGLTGIPNRRSFDDFFAREWKRGLREATPLSLLMIDIDFFKPFNDNHGHQAGDDCIKAVAKTIASYPRRPDDMSARYGGEEFAVILGNTPIDKALLVAEQIRAGIELLQYPHGFSKIGPAITVSVGVSCIVPDAAHKEADLLRAADEGLYRSKENGRNRVTAKPVL